MPIMEIKVLPVGTKKSSVSRHIARVIKVLAREKGIRFQVTPMGTIVEANTRAKLLRVADKMHQAAFGAGIKRVVTFMEIDERRDKKLTMAGKLASLKKHLGH